MLKLWLDDTRDAPKGWVRVLTAEDAIAFLRDCGLDAFDDISLDHDLGRVKSGYDVAVWIEEKVFTNKLTSVPRIRAHSANPTGRDNISAAIASIERLTNQNR